MASNFKPVRIYRNLSEAVVQGLASIFDEGKYADKVIEKILKSNPKWGARDRRFIAETIYDIVRWYRLFSVVSESRPGDYWKLLGTWCLWNQISPPPWEEFRALNQQKIEEAYKQAVNDRKIAESIPDWLDDMGQQELKHHWAHELHALNEEAKVLLRVNTLKVKKAELQRQLAEEEIFTQSNASYPDALFLEERQNIFTRQQFRDGLFEVQDAGSQLIAPFLNAQQGMRVIDACAGAGGKTLHLSALLQNKGKIIAMDTEAWKLDELKKRARRAGATNIEPRLIDSSKVIKRLANSADALLLDVPCSGLGVLKRNPDAKWKLTPEFIKEVKDTQSKILEDYSLMLKPDGNLVYSTCSIFPSENEKQVQQFLKTHGEFTLEDEKTIYPSEGFDGFYMARLKKKRS